MFPDRPEVLDAAAKRPADCIHPRPAFLTVIAQGGYISILSRVPIMSAVYIIPTSQTSDTIRQKDGFLWSVWR